MFTEFTVVINDDEFVADEPIAVAVTFIHCGRADVTSVACESREYVQSV